MLTTWMKLSALIVACALVTGPLQLFGKKYEVALCYELDLDGSTDAVRERAVDATIAIMKKRLKKVGIRSKVVATSESEFEVRLHDKGAEQIQRIRRVLEWAGTLELVIVATDEELTAAGVDSASEAVRREQIEEQAKATPQGGKPPIYAGPAGDAGKLFRWAYVQEAYDDDGRPAGDGFYLKSGDEFGIDGNDIAKVYPDVDGKTGNGAVGFRIKKESQSKLAELTRANLNRQLAIVLNGLVQSAPSIESELSTGGIITGGGSGGFERSEVADLIATLQAGTIKYRPIFQGERRLE